MQNNAIRKLIYKHLKTFLIIFVFCTALISFVTLTTLDYVETDATITSVSKQIRHKRKSINKTYYSVFYEYTYNDTLYESSLDYDKSKLNNREVGFTETIEIDPNNPKNIKDTPFIDEIASFAGLSFVVLLISTIIQIIKYKISGVVS